MLTGSVVRQHAAGLSTAGIESSVRMYMVLVRGRGMAPALVRGVTLRFYGVDVNAGGAAVLVRALGGIPARRTHAENVHPIDQHS